VAQQREDLVLVHVKAEIVDRHLLAKCLAQLVHHYRRRPGERLVHLLCGDGCTVLQRDVHFFPLVGVMGPGSFIACGGAVHPGALLGEPVRGRQREVKGLVHTHLAGPDLREVPRQQRIYDDVGRHNAADQADINAVVGLEEGTAANLQRQWREEATDDLRVLVGDAHCAGGKHHDVDHEEGCIHNAKQRK
jgi:hypothetical protein